MRLHQIWQTRLPLSELITISALMLFSAEAQNDLPDLTSADSEPTTRPSRTTGRSTPTPTNDSDSEETDASRTESDEAAETSATDELPGLESSTDDLPELTGLPTLTDLPTITSSVTKFTHPPPTVPPTANAPYMQKSNLPEGMVFICVGGALAFIALVMIAWRIVVTWMVNRSVKKAAMTQYTHDSKGLLQPSRKSGFYSHSPDSSMSMEKLTKAGRHMSAPPKGQTPNASLFFSPTAGAGMHSMGGRNSSGYLPAGYYSVGNAAASGNNKRPQSDNFANNAGRYEDSPEHSPELQPHRLSAYESSISLNATAGHGSRAPSVFLDDLMSAPPLPPPHNNSRRSSDYRR